MVLLAGCLQGSKDAELSLPELLAPMSTAASPELIAVRVKSEKDQHSLRAETAERT